MIRQIRLLAGLSLRGMFGINKLRFTKDKKKKLGGCLMGVLWAFLILMAAGYAGGVSFGLVYMGMGYYVPAVLGIVVSLIVFFFTCFKAGAVIFDLKAYEKQIALPVTVRAVITSRFLTMYFTNMLFGAVVMLPGMAVYGVMERPGLSFWLCGIIATLFLPLLPLTAASAVGALIAGISSRLKRKNLIATLLTLLFVSAIMVGSLQLKGMEESQAEALLQQAAGVLEERIRSSYPPAIWIADGVVKGETSSLLLFLSVSLGGFIVFLEIVQRFYHKICGLLGAREAKGHFRMKELREGSVMRSLIEREWRHYFSSTVWVTNTMMGQILQVILAIAVLTADRSAVEAMLGIPGIIGRALPILLGVISAMMPLTAASVSMEGRHWWMMQTLPVTRKEVMRSKIALQLIVALPFYLISEALIFAALRPGPGDAVSLLAVPAVYIVFGARTGLAVNEKFPVFDWDNEIRAVKQGASVFIMMMIGMIAGAVPAGILIAFPGIPAHGVYAVTIAVLAAATGILEMRGSRKRLWG